jgi:L-threonylcarbamoyladenylate synthase
MIAINMDEYNIHKNTILNELRNTIFIYPTDTIYGIGCNATDEKLVSKIRNIKKSNQPFSVIVPNKEWIYHNCVVSQEAEEWIRKLPGPYTLILKLKNRKAVAKNAHNSNGTGPTIGIRMPNHWFLGVVSQLKFPIITTSANITGHNFMTSLDDLDSNIRNTVDYVFYEGQKQGVPSTIINLSGEKVSIISRSSKPSIGDKTINFPIKEISLAND